MFADVGNVPAVLQSTGREDKDMGQWWVFALVIIFFALIFWRRDGNDRNPLADVAALHAVNGTGATRAVDAAAFTELNGRLDGISQQINHINDVNDLRDLKRTQTDLSLQIATNRTDTLLNFKDLALQTANCCCEVQRGQDQIRFDNAQNTCQIISNNDANTQKILDRMCQDEVTRLRDELAKERLMSSQAIQNAYLVDRLRPYPQPAFGVFPPVPVMESV